MSKIIGKNENKEKYNTSKQNAELKEEHQKGKKENSTKYFEENLVNEIVNLIFKKREQLFKKYSESQGKTSTFFTKGGKESKIYCEEYREEFIKEILEEIKKILEGKKLGKNFAFLLSKKLNGIGIDTNLKERFLNSIKNILHNKEEKKTEKNIETINHYRNFEIKDSDNLSTIVEKVINKVRKDAYKEFSNSKEGISLFYTKGVKN